MKYKTTAFRLSLLLWFGGIHKFYLWKTIQGVLYFLFCFSAIPFFLSLYDAYKLYKMSHEAFDEQYNNGQVSYRPSTDPQQPKQPTKFWKYFFICFGWLMVFSMLIAEFWPEPSEEELAQMRQEKLLEENRKERRENLEYTLVEEENLDYFNCTRMNYDYQIANWTFQEDLEYLAWWLYNNHKDSADRVFVTLRYEVQDEGESWVYLINDEPDCEKKRTTEPMDNISTIAFTYPEINGWTEERVWVGLQE